ncbi:Piwi-like protein 2 [Tyrophagus putrescentiae]|nr:Piwi-like protein 2 [Tyrophagus putrescentiae]
MADQNVGESALYLPKKIDNFSLRGITNPFTEKYSNKIDLTVIYQKEVPLSEQVKFFNDFFDLIRQCFDSLIAQCFQASKNEIDVLDYWLSSSPGVITEVTEFNVDESNQQIDLLVKSDMSNLIATQDNMFELMKIFSSCKDTFLVAVKSHFIGSVVKVTYGDTNKEYMIGDIDEKRNPDSMIKDRSQPLLIHIEYVHERRKHLRTELIPELCRLSKISDGNNLVDVEAGKPLAPIIRYQKLMKFFDIIYQSNATKCTLSDWGFSIERSVHTVLADNLPPAWNHLLRGSLLDPVDLNNKWLIIYYTKDRWIVDAFLRRCEEFAQKMSIKIDAPRKYGLNRQDTETYLNAVIENISKEDRIVVIVTPGSLQIQERYDAIKQYCTEVRGIPTQFVRSATLTQPRKMETVSPNILVQMNCKAGGVPWSVEMPLQNAMYVGLDVYRGFLVENADDERQQPILGFAASTNAQGTRWFSKVAEQPLNGICNENLGWLVRDALHQYKKNNRVLPSSIVVYRKEGSVKWTNIDHYEWPILIASIEDVYKKDAVEKGVEYDNKPYVVLMSVTRRISPGFSVEGGGNWFENDDSPPITNKQVLEALRVPSSRDEEEKEAVCESSSEYITADDEEFGELASRQSFNLCSPNTQLSCISPVLVRVLRQWGTPTGLKEADPDGCSNPSVLSTKLLQSLSVKLCYLYFNIAAICPLPSPILYAQKLAFFAGNHLKKEANEVLENKLYFL